MANLKKMGLSSSGDESQGFNQASNEQYVTSQSNFMLNQLIQSANAKAAAIKSGDMKAVAQINANYEQIIAEGTKSLATDLASQNQNAAARKEQADTLAANTQAKATTAFQSALNNPSITPGAASTLENLPSNWNDMTAVQKAQAQDITGGLFDMADKTGTYGDMSTDAGKAAAWTAIQGSLTNSIKQQTRDVATQRAQIALLTAQTNAANKQIAATSAATLASTPQGQGFLDGYQTAGIHNKDKNSETLQSIESKVSSGNIKSAQEEIVNAALSTGSATDVRMYNTLQGLPDIMNTITTAIKKLPADQQPGLLNGTWQNIAAKFGQNPDPALRTIAAEMGHVQKNYITGVYGMRAASLQSDSIFNNLFPAGTDSASLSFSVASGLINTAKDTLNSQVKARLGSSAYSQIFNGGDAAGTFTKSGKPFDYAGAINAGYSDSDIQTILSKN